MKQEVKSYWEERAGQNQTTVTGTTNDVYLRELEIKESSCGRRLR